LCAVLWVRVELVECFADMGEVEGEDGDGLPVVRVMEGREGGGEDDMSLFRLVACGTGFEVGDRGWVGDGLDADL